MTTIPVNQIFPNPEQPRTIFDPLEIESLAQSIKFNNLIQPITVEDTGNGYILVDGERRWRAYRLLGLETIEASIMPMSNHNGHDRLMKALVANIQRSAMGPLDEARAYKKLIDELGSIDAVCEHIGISSTTILLRLKLLNFDLSIQNLYNRKQLPLEWRSVVALSRLPSEDQVRIAMMAATRGANATTLTKLCKNAEKQQGITQPQRAPKIIKQPKSGEHYSALLMVNLVPDNLVEPVGDTCKTCPLYDMASNITCRECPMVSLLRRL